MKRIWLAWLAGIGWLAAALPAAVARAEPAYALGLYGPADVKRGPAEPFPYVNPAAPKGGRLNLRAQAPFTKLNPFSLKGVPAPLLDLVFESAGISSGADDEPFTVYGHLAESFDLAPDRRSLTLRIHPAARFGDGQPVTAADFVFSFEIMRDPEYNPMARQYYADVLRAVAVDARTVRYDFARANQELPLITAQMPILPRHVYGAPGKQFGRDFDQVAVGSGPYVVEQVEFGKFITVRRNPEWWARDLPRSQGRFNFDTITAKVYLDPVPLKEGFKGGEFDVLLVNIAKEWALDYQGPFVQRHYILRREIPHRRPASMQGYVFNQRRPLFQSLKLRHALALAFDFPWSNANLFFNQYTRTRCFFENSPDLTDTAPPSGAVLARLRELRAKHGPLAVPKAALEQPLQAPGADLPPAEALRLAGVLLDSGGWVRGPDGIRVRGGQRLAFELLIDDPTWQRVSEPYQQRLRELGAELAITLLQPPEYEKRLRSYDFDLVVAVFGHSRSPGNELLGYFGSAAAAAPGGANLAGLRNPAVDEVLDGLVRATSRAELAFHCRLLDRLLVAETLLVPHWHLNRDRVLAWNKFGRPARHCSQEFFESVVRDTWWADPERERRRRAAMARGEALPPELERQPTQTPEAP